MGDFNGDMKLLLMLLLFRFWMESAFRGELFVEEFKFWMVSAFRGELFVDIICSLFSLSGMNIDGV